MSKTRFINKHLEDQILNYIEKKKELDSMYKKLCESLAKREEHMYGENEMFGEYGLSLRSPFGYGTDMYVDIEIKDSPTGEKAVDRNGEYVDQSVGMCSEDDFYGTYYYKLSDGRYVGFPYATF